MKPANNNQIRAELLENGTVLRLLLNQPKANILTIAMVRELQDALDTHRDLKDLKLVVLRGAGGCFSYGASIQEHRRETAADMLTGFHRLVRDLATFPVPTAALVEGPCLGGGFEVALCCNFIFATSDAAFACPEIKLGVIPPVLATVGRHRLGGPTTERLVLTGGELSLEQAEHVGWLTARLNSRPDPEAELLAWFHDHLAPLSAYALRQGTRATRIGAAWVTALDQDLETVEKLYLDDIVPSHDGNEGIEAFLEKRAPRWTNA